MRRLLTGLLVAFALPSSALASSGINPVIADCARNGTITGHYTEQQYQQALASMPAGMDEYSDCPSEIRAAALAEAAGLPVPKFTNGTNAQNNPLNSAPPAARSAEAAAVRNGVLPRVIEGSAVTPGVVRTAALNRLPTPLILVLALLAATALLLGGGRLRELVRARRSQ